MENNHNYLSDEQLAAFLDGNVSGKELKDILYHLPEDMEAEEILSLSPIIDSELDSQSDRILPMKALAAANPQNLCSFECELELLRWFGIDADHWSLLETAKANRWLHEEGTPLHHVGRLLELKGLHVDRRYDATIQYIADEIDDGHQVMVVVDKNLLDKKKSGKNVPPAFHALIIEEVQDNDMVMYWDNEKEQPVKIKVTDFMKAWQPSGCFALSTSDEQMEYNPHPISVEDIELDADLVDLTEAIAENAHDIWARARMDEGWTYGSVRNDEKKHHPDLIPYSQLPESEKEYDRLMAMQTLRLVRRLGYQITR